MTAAYRHPRYRRLTVAQVLGRLVSPLIQVGPRMGQAAAITWRVTGYDDGSLMLTNIHTRAKHGIVWATFLSLLAQGLLTLAD